MSPTPITPTGILRDQHRNILKVADVLEAVLGNEPTPGALDYAAIEDCARFIRLYADALHHGKEENILFVELEDRGMPRSEGPLAVMLSEHEQGRALVRSLLDALPAAREGDEAARSRVLNAGLGYVSLIRGHIQKEDNVLFNWADQMIEPMACQKLCASYDAVCRRTFDGCTVTQLEDLLTSLRARYPDA